MHTGYTYPPGHMHTKIGSEDSNLKAHSHLKKKNAFIVCFFDMIVLGERILKI